MRKVSLILSILMLVSSAASAQTANPATPAQTMPAKTMVPMNPVAVNTATAAQLAAIPGVGPRTTAAIIAARPFKTSADLIKRSRAPCREITSRCIWTRFSRTE
jgi:DNA uptake protein ComE-like DNA-binding protein